MTESRQIKSKSSISRLKTCNKREEGRYLLSKPHSLNGPPYDLRSIVGEEILREIILDFPSDLYFFLWICSKQQLKISEAFPMLKYVKNSKFQHRFVDHLAHLGLVKLEWDKPHKGKELLMVDDILVQKQGFRLFRSWLKYGLVNLIFSIPYEVRRNIKAFNKFCKQKFIFSKPLKFIPKSPKRTRSKESSPKDRTYRKASKKVQEATIRRYLNQTEYQNDFGYERHKREQQVFHKTPQELLNLRKDAKSPAWEIAIPREAKLHILKSTEALEKSREEENPLPEVSMKKIKKRKIPSSRRNDEKIFFQGVNLQTSRFIVLLKKIIQGKYNKEYFVVEAEELFNAYNCKLLLNPKTEKQLFIKLVQVAHRFVGFRNYRRLCYLFSSWNRDFCMDISRYSACMFKNMILGGKEGKNYPIHRPQDFQEKLNIWNGLRYKFKIVGRRLYVKFSAILRDASFDFLEDRITFPEFEKIYEIILATVKNESILEELNQIFESTMNGEQLK